VPVWPLSVSVWYICVVISLLMCWFLCWAGAESKVRVIFSGWFDLVVCYVVKGSMLVARCSILCSVGWVGWFLVNRVFLFWVGCLLVWETWYFLLYESFRSLWWVGWCAVVWCGGAGVAFIAVFCFVTLLALYLVGCCTDCAVFILVGCVIASCCGFGLVAVVVLFVCSLLFFWRWV